MLTAELGLAGQLVVIVCRELAYIICISIIDQSLISANAFAGRVAE
ncbi:hypothetical protein [Nocardia sp. SYP-A9097]|nr:hypothetical protein [Nocardia sp. SYP-A9097]